MSAVSMATTMTVTISRWLFYLALIAITILALVPQQQAVVTTGWDKSNHVLAFWVLLLLMDNAYPPLNLWVRKVLPLLAYGLLIECLQGFSPGRHFSLMDVVADFVGLIAYILLRPFLLDKIPFINTESFRPSSR